MSTIAVLVVLFVVSQLVLPSIAKHVAHDRLSAYGRVESLSLSAFPAVELLWGHVGSMKVQMADFHASGSKLTKSLSQADEVGKIDATAGTVTSGLVTMHNVTVTKRGTTFSVRGEITEANLRSSLPVLNSVEPVGDVHGVLTLAVTTDSFPLIGAVSADASVFPTDGTIEVAASGALGSFLHLTVFSNPRLYVTSVSGKAVSGGLAVSATGQLR